MCATQNASESGTTLIVATLFSTVIWPRWRQDFPSPLTTGGMSGRTQSAPGL